MKDYFLRAQSREQIDQSLTAAGLLTIVDGEPITSPEVVIDYVGTIYRPSGALDEEGIQVMEPVEGYHVNLRGNLMQQQVDKLPIIDAPNNPQRIFAGGIL